MPAGAGDGTPVQRGRRRVVRLQRADRGDLDPLDAPADRALTQVGGERLDLGQFRHARPTVALLPCVKVVVAHNRYRQAQPSGENVIVDAEIAQLARRRCRGAAVPAQLRRDRRPAGGARRRCCRCRRSTRRAAQRDLAELISEQRPDVLHLHNPYPLLSPWVVRTAHAHGVPVVQTVHNYRQVCASGLYFRDGHICHGLPGQGVRAAGGRARAATAARGAERGDGDHAGRAPAAPGARSTATSR